VPLALRGYVALPPHVAGDFDHGDVHLNAGRVFVAHAANGTLEVIDGGRLALDRTVPGCPEGSGVLCAQGDDSSFSPPNSAQAKFSCWTPLAARYVTKSRSDQSPTVWPGIAAGGTYW
jgi:hypothetical protein